MKILLTSIAVFALAGIFGCDTGTENNDVPIESVTGTWILESSTTGLILFDDNRFMYMEGDGEPPNGMEAGTYDFDPSAGTITFFVTFDGNSDGGIAPESNGIAIPVAGDSSQLILTVTDNDGTTSITFNSEPTGGIGIEGTWLNVPTVDESFSALVLTADGRLMYGEGAGVEPNGMEAGTYDYFSGMDSIQFIVTFDNNNDGGIAPDWNGINVSAIISDSTLTLDGSFSLTRQ